MRWVEVIVCVEVLVCVEVIVCVEVGGGGSVC